MLTFVSNCLHHRVDNNKMPASSRKRGKGKERKAKKAAVAARETEINRLKWHNLWVSWYRGDSIKKTIETVIQCDHGLAVTLPGGDESHPVISFIDSYFSNNGSMTLKDTIGQEHEEIWNNDSYLKMAANILTRIGANLLAMDHDSSTPRLDLIKNMSFVITMLEKYGETFDYNSTIYRRDIVKKYAILQNQTTINRDLLKFFRKRMNCSCLKKLHLEARKNSPKLGKCDTCKQVKDRAQLMVCSRCMIAQYCSRECQVSALPRHRGICDMFVRAHQRTIDST